MNSTHASRKAFAYLLVFVLFLSVAGIAAASPLPVRTQNAGGVHSADTSSITKTLEVNVSRNGKAAAHVTVEISKADGTSIASGSTSSSGIYSTTLASGTYTVTAISGGSTASKTVTVSASPTVINLSLSPNS